MSIIIREMIDTDRKAVFDMMKVFYASPAVATNGSDEVFQADIDHCIGACPYLEGYVFQDEQGIQGYGMVAKSFSTEYGKLCIWIEDLYIKEPFRGTGIGSKFLDFVAGRYPGTILKLEVEKENERAIKVYEKCGYVSLPYHEMLKKNG
ncbi:MAG: GNAT family N-acetyltransferase [Lachnospiraceae bacterium]|nr:GNAT family N-acetyltransferase [Lachnospiraceae bacterium]